MKRTIIAIFCGSLLAAGAHAQNALVNGFTGMAAVNATTYQKTAVVGNPTGGYAFVCSSHDGSQFFASAFFMHYLYFIDAGTYAITDSINRDVYHISGSNESNTLFARIGYGLCRINTLTKTFTDSIAITDPFYVKERPDSKEVWVTNDNKITVVDYSSGLSATSFAVSSSTNSDYDEVSFTNGGSTAYKVAGMSHKVYKINAATKAIIDSAVCGNSVPYSVVPSGDSSKIFVAFPNDNKIRIYQTPNMGILDSIDCGSRGPFEVYHHPTRAEIWVMDHLQDSITVFNEATYAQIAAFPVTSGPHSIAFGSGTSAAGNTAKATGINVYPNPATDMIHISGIEAGDAITIYDIMGKAVCTREAHASMEDINVKPFTPGVYVTIVSDQYGHPKGTFSIKKV